MRAARALAICSNAAVGTLRFRARMLADRPRLRCAFVLEAGVSSLRSLKRVAPSFLHSRSISYASGCSASGADGLAMSRCSR